MDGPSRSTARRQGAADPSTRALVRSFLACMAVLGAMLAFRTPPMSGFDEPFHWRRALQLADLHPLATRLGANDWGGRLDRRAVAFETGIDQATSAAAPLSIAAVRALSDGSATGGGAGAGTPAGGAAGRGTETVSFPSTASFSPLPYLPAACGLAVARALHLGLLAQVHAGRLANLAAYLLLVWWVVLLLPVGRLAALALLTVPTALHLAASFSADPVCNALPALLAAGCLRLRLGPEPPPRGWLYAGFLLVLLLGLLKPTCCVLSALVLLLPDRLFRSPRAAWCARLAAIIGCLAVAAGWNASYPFVPGLYWHSGADPRQAVRVLLSAPVHGLLLLARNGWDDSWFWWLDGWGRYGGGPGPYHFTVPEPLATLFLVVLLCLVVVDRGPGRSRPVSACAMAVLALAYVAALLLAFRIGYGPPAAAFIDGVQGRYLLLPELLLVLAAALGLPHRGRSQLAGPLLLGCLALDVGSAVIAVGRYAAVWH